MMKKRVVEHVNICCLVCRAFNPNIRCCSLQLKKYQLRFSLELEHQHQIQYAEERHIR